MLAEALQAEVDAFASVFISDVAGFRGVSVADVTGLVTAETAKV